MEVDDTMPLFNVVTCGTSLLTSRLDKDKRAIVFKHANKKKQDYAPEELQQIDALLSLQREKLLSADEQTARMFSAELNGLIGYYRERCESDCSTNGDLTCLICSDTYQGKQVAHILAEWGRNHDMNMTVQPIDDLSTACREEFQLGINNLVDWCQANLPGYRQSGYRVVFNLVGGFKALQGYMQTLGMFYADEIIYIFETSKELLSIPRLPLDLNANIKKILRDNLPLVRKLYSLHELHFTTKRTECHELPDLLLNVVGNDCEISAWGKLMFCNFKNELYCKSLLPPWSDRILYAKGLDNLVDKTLDPDKRVLLNEAIDKLCVYFHTDGRVNIASLNLRPLRAPLGPSTHEFNAWSTQNAWRCFCHYENKQGDEKSIVIDAIDVGLGH
jgi:putative CRISPR-associated protein (TIGR02619 family)